MTKPDLGSETVTRWLQGADQFLHGMCRTCGHLRDDHSIVGCADGGGRCTCHVRTAIVGNPDETPRPTAADRAAAGICVSCGGTGTIAWGRTSGAIDGTVPCGGCGGTGKRDETPAPIATAEYRGTTPVDVLAVNELTGTAVVRLQHSDVRPCTVALTRLSRITAIVAADVPVCVICGDRIEGEAYDCGVGPEHLDCHHDDPEHDADGPFVCEHCDVPVEDCDCDDAICVSCRTNHAAGPECPTQPDEVDPDLITEILHQLDRPGMLADLTGWNWDDEDYTRAAAFIRAGGRSCRPEGAALAAAVRRGVLGWTSAAESRLSPGDVDEITASVMAAIVTVVAVTR